MVIRSISPSRSTVTEFGSTTTGFGVDEDAEDAVDAAEDAVAAAVDSLVSGTVVPATVLVVAVALVSCASTG